MASEAEMSETSFLEQLIINRNRDLSLLLPFILGFMGSSPIRESEDPDQETGTGTHERFILVNPFTQGMIVIGGRRSLDDLLRDLSIKEGPLPASKASIEAMPKVEITEEEGDGDCAICLEDWEIGGEARVMPCKHRYHTNCIEKWLEIHGSCPVCRFKMPVDEDEHKKIGDGDGDGGDEEGRGRRVSREIWFGFSFNDNNSRRDSNTNDSSSSPRPDFDAAIDGASMED
ncbi:hypothetical protein HHK36_015352 [Tetracentron sinense]|uniref:RING-type E3 ubiquitin transferase n=1 Tax=Tetracentron sinense TaxID=13715 RepID=A0A834Z927_TETSI|nr:hypothetical protein HHK36_015352 [Tetracentron sinense]